MKPTAFLLCLLPAAMAGELFRDDFSRFPPRIFSEPVKQLTNALHEYHYVHDRGVSLEVVLWDRHSVCVYTQDRPFQGAKIYAPIRNPDYYDSNYRVSESLPDWENRKD